MWGHDRTPADPADPDADAQMSADPANKQWLELYNNTDRSVAQTETPMIILRFIPDRYVVNFGYPATAGGISTRIDPATGDYATVSGVPNPDNMTAAGAAIATDDVDTTTNPAELYTAFYRVVDRVSNIDRARWFVPGNSGNTQVNADFPTTNSLVSAYRVAPLATNRRNYRGHPATMTTAFADGTQQNGWGLSIRRRNIRGPYVASPGSSHVYEELAIIGDTVTRTPSPPIVSLSTSLETTLLMRILIGLNCTTALMRKSM